MRTAKLKNKGFTLVEVMVAMLILFIGMMALLWALTAAVEHNLKNQMTDEAVRLGEDRMNILRGMDIAALASGNATVVRRFRNTDVPFNVTWTVQNLSASNSRAVRISVTWSWKGTGHQHVVTSIMSRDL